MNKRKNETKQVTGFTRKVVYKKVWPPHFAEFWNKRRTWSLRQLKDGFPEEIQVGNEIIFREFKPEIERGGDIPFTEGLNGTYSGRSVRVLVTEVRCLAVVLSWFREFLGVNVPTNFFIISFKHLESMNYSEDKNQTALF